MKASEILKSVTENLRISVTALTNECQLSKDRLHNIMQGKVKNISDDVASAICLRYPQFSRSWLLTGEGNMFADGTVLVPSDYPDVLTPAQVLESIMQWSNDSAAELARKSGISKGNISSILSGKHKVKNISFSNAERICKAYPELEMMFVLRGEGPMLKDGRNVNNVIQMVRPVVNIGKIKEGETEKDRIKQLEDKVEQLMHALTDLTHEVKNRREIGIASDAMPEYGKKNEI